jgi:hypothetical protein
VSPVLASSRAGNFIRALLAVLLIALLFREMYLLWFFHTGAWTSRPKEVRWCATWYERVSGPDRSRADVERLAGGAVHQVARSPVWRPIVAYRPSRACPTWIFAQVSSDGFVTYTLTQS